MPWTETCVMQERVKFIMDVSDSTYSMAELFNYYGISRKTGYKWLDRYRQGGIEALRNHSRGRKDVYFRRTKIEDFPNGFGPAQLAFSPMPEPLTEAVHI